MPVSGPHSDISPGTTLNNEGEEILAGLFLSLPSGPALPVHPPTSRIRKKRRAFASRREQPGITAEKSCVGTEFPLAESISCMKSHHSQLSERRCHEQRSWTRFWSSRCALRDGYRVRTTPNHCCLQEKNTGSSSQGLTSRVGHGIGAPETPALRFGPSRTRQV